MKFLFTIALIYTYLTNPLYASSQTETETQVTPFSYSTDVFSYDKVNGFKQVGSFYDNSVSADTHKEINEGNFVCAPFYYSRFIDCDYINFGAIIVGTKDETLVRILKEAFLNKHIGIKTSVPVTNYDIKLRRLE